MVQFWDWKEWMFVQFWVEWTLFIWNSLLGLLIWMRCTCYTCSLVLKREWINFAPQVFDKMFKRRLCSIRYFYMMNDLLIWVYIPTMCYYVMEYFMGLHKLSIVLSNWSWMRMNNIDWSYLKDFLSVVLIIVEECCNHMFDGSGN